MKWQTVVIKNQGTDEQRIKKVLYTMYTKDIDLITAANLRHEQELEKLLDRNNGKKYTITIRKENKYTSRTFYLENGKIIYRK